MSAPLARGGAAAATRGGARPLHLLALAVSLLTRPVSGYPEYVPYNPNGAAVPGVAAIGHMNPNGGGPRNEYGVAFGKAHSSYGPALCAVDSDGDGQSNGFELGDECCTWTHAAQTPLQSTSISNPGDKASVSTRPPCDGTCGGGGALPPCACCPGPASNSSSPSPTPSLSTTPSPSPSNGSSASPSAGSGGGNNPAGGAASPAVIGGAAGGGGLIVGFAAAAALFGFGRRLRPTAGGEDDEEGGFAPLRGDEPSAPVLRGGAGRTGVN